jgi:hypothetical protein
MPAYGLQSKILSPETKGWGCLHGECFPAWLKLQGPFPSTAKAKKKVKAFIFRELCGDMFSFCLVNSKKREIKFSVCLKLKVFILAVKYLWP